MTAAINEGFIGWLHENCYFVRWIFLVREISISFAAARNSAQYAGFPPKVGGSARQSIHGGGNKWDERKGKFSSKMGYTGGIIQRDYSAGQCFLLRDLIPLNVFK